MATLQDAKNAITGYQAPTIPQVGGNVVGAQKPPDLGVMSFLGGIGHSIASGYQAAAAQHQQPAFNQGSSPLTQSGQIGALNNQPSLLSQGQSAFNTTPSGGTTFSPTIAKAASKPAIATPQPTASSGGLNSGASGLAQYTQSPYQTPNGGTFNVDGNGNMSGYTPARGYSINGSGASPSSAFSGGSNPYNTHSTYADLVNGVSQAQIGVGQASQYSPAYLQAYQAQQQAQANQAAVGAGLVSRAAPTLQNYLQNPSSFGDTMGYAQSLNGQEQALASQQQTQANIAQNTQQLARTGNIAAAQSGVSAAQTQLQYSPQGAAGSNALTQYNTLQQAYPGANIPEYNQTLTPEQNQQIASYIVSNSPAYRSQFQAQYQTPAGGTGIYNKLNTGGMQQNPDGTISLVSDATASLGAAQRSSLNQNVSTYNQLAPAFQAANKDFSYITNFMQQAGINQSGIPAINQVSNYAKAKGIDPGVVAQFKAGIASLRTNYSAMLGSRGETPTQAGADSAQLIPDNITPEAMAKVQEALNANGKNILDSTQQQIQSTLNSIGGGSQSFQGSSVGGSTSSGGSIYDF